MIEMPPYLTFSVVLLGTFSTILGQLSEGQNCRTPNGEIAKCITLTSFIDNYAPLLKHSSQEIASFARQSQCDSADQIPLICCGSVDHHIKNTQATGYLRHRLLPENCGISEVVGGEVAELGEFPWMASLGRVADDGSTLHLCGGSLISSRYVLTVAHCSRRVTVTTVRLGEFDRSKDIDCITTSEITKCGDPVVDVGVEKFIKHPSYRHSHKINDIALVKLTRNINFSRFIKPICLPNKDAVVEPTSTVVILGWGATTTANESEVILKAEIKVKENNLCSKKLNKEIYENQFCAGGDRDGGDSCAGDSGGPAMKLFLNTSPQRWLLEGIISFGAQCGTEGYPTVHTRVSKHIDWILENIQ